MNAHVEKATWGQVLDLSPHIREADRKEVWASNHLEAGEALKLSFLNTSNALSIVSDSNVPIAIFGCSCMSSVLRIGVPWLLGSDDIMLIARQFLRQSKPNIYQYFEDYDLLQNYVSVENKISIRWLKWCGFHMEEAKPYGASQELFHRFYARKGETLCV